ncbi:hypothetical protein PENSPDRAFT_184361 [Peniophora sp. CONT]|nr:hypothetical protein PENSPDRAFT_184361 [Peniophora sp. CONT]
MPCMLADGNQRLHQFLRILASFATATREELGYDDTVKFVEFEVIDEKKPDVRIWDYLVHDEDGFSRVFRTIRPIADNGTDALTGRGNRVWEVRELVGGGSLKGPSLALKDTWLDHDRLPEYKTLREIEKDLGDDPRRRHLLKVEHAGQVRRSDGKGDTTNAAVCDLERFQPIYLREDLVLKQNVEPGSRNSLTSLPDKSTYPHLLQPEIYHGKSWSLRRHDRMVSEFGDVFSGMTRYDTVFYTLHGALCALSAFHDAGWIHRDISPYNILLVKRVPGDPCSCNYSDCRARTIDGMELVAVLMDVEFALKLSSDDPHHAMCSGTLDFMSRDVIGKSWDVSLLPPSCLLDFPHDTLPFRQNTFDDVQAFLWILVWTLLYSFLGGSLAHQSSPDRFRKAYYAITTFYNNVSAQIPLCWASTAEFAKLLETALPDATYVSFIDLAYAFHLQLRQQHSIAFTAAYSAEMVTVDVTTLALHTPLVITAGMKTMRELLRVAQEDDKLSQTEFNLKKAARRPSVKEWKQLPSLK